MLNVGTLLREISRTFWLTGADGPVSAPPYLYYC